MSTELENFFRWIGLLKDLPPPNPRKELSKKKTKHSNFLWLGVDDKTKNLWLGKKSHY